MPGQESLRRGPCTPGWSCSVLLCKAEEELPPPHTMQTDKHWGPPEGRPSNTCLPTTQRRVWNADS